MIKPTYHCNELRKEDAGKEACLAGWVSSWRDHGGVVFIDIRDNKGVTQVVFGREKSGLPEEKEKELNSAARKLRNEYVIAVKGEVIPRPEGTENKKIDTGGIEVVCHELEVLNPCSELPFDFKNMEEVGEESRLKYRYLEMRAGKLKDNLVFKHRFFQATRRYFTDKDFCEIETPFLTKSTPEGARDFLVPSRINQGSFYALPQSPQLFKQILMVGGFMRYFQIVKCFRDEDLRQDRQPEFTQLDLEMSFIDEEDIMSILEEYISNIFSELLGKKIQLPFRRIPYAEAMQKYGSDKPDLRIPVEIVDITGMAKECAFKVFKNAASGGGVVRGIKIPDAERISLTVIDKVTKEISGFGAKGLAWMRHKDDGLQSQITKFFGPQELVELQEVFDTKPGDILLFIADKSDVAEKSLGYLRTKFFEPDPADYQLLWVVDYPLFEKDEESGNWTPMHHPFTSAHPDDMEILRSGNTDDFGKVRSRAYDMVLNGSEIGGGSIRIHSIEDQKTIFKSLGIEEKESQEKFGFLLKALSYGAPPHGGFAFGVDRLVTMMLGLNSIRDVIPFPKTQKAYSPLSDAPSPVSDKQLRELAVKVDLPDDNL